MKQSLIGQRVLILGLGISGLSMARWCVRLGAHVLVVDTRRQPPELAQLQALQSTTPSSQSIQFESRALSADLIAADDIRAVFKSPGLSPQTTADLMQAAKALGLWVGGELSLFNHALRELRQSQHYAPLILAITGTNGKTTTTALTTELVKRSGKTVATAGNIGPALMDTVGQHLEAYAVDQIPLPQVWVLELSSFQLNDIDDFEPTAATVLNLSQDHLDWHGSMAAYVQAKENIYGKKKSDTQIAVVDGSPSVAGQYGLSSIAGMTWLVRAVSTDSEPTQRVKIKGVRVATPIKLQPLMPSDALRIRGRHNAFNALAALALAERAGCKLAPMLFGLREYRGEPHRMQSLGIYQGVEYIDDSKGTNVGATVAALTSLGQDLSGKKIIVILGGDGKGQDFTPLLAPTVQYVRALVLIGKDAELIEKTLTPALTECSLHRADNLPEATKLCADLARSGDCVLLSPACASLDMFKDYKHRAQVFAQSLQMLDLAELTP